MSEHAYRNARFLLSAREARQFPADSGREVAFVGRSNVGKSSVINTITDQKALARTSKTPGRTQLINFFGIDPERRLVDLPGYGFARVPRAMQVHWRSLINAYLNRRSSLAGLIMILDIRRDLSQEDLMMLNGCQATGTPVHVVLNKADKFPYGRRQQALLAMQREAPANASVQLYSALEKTGMETAREVLDTWLDFKKKRAPALNMGKNGTPGPE
jgi:GTP-binding protein